MLKFITNRIRFAAKYATRKQLIRALVLDALLLAVATAAGKSLLVHAHPFIATFFLIGSAFEGTCVGTTIYLLTNRNRQAA